MAMSCRYAAQSCARQLRSARAARAPAQLVRIPATSRRWNSTEAAPVNPKVEAIVDQISQLTLLETADLVSSLKVSAVATVDLNWSLEVSRFSNR
jgi:large subunit ribosomal protein L7/L12